MLLFVGAMGKSAQIPLYVWLPDAMAGPTPVSALIHAATMVTAGVYMIARLNVIYVLSPSAMGIVATVGALTALFAATIALVQNDIKKVLAYSTISQLGYMFLGVGVGAFAAGTFHLFTHAFFKALLFLGAGAVIHAMHHAHAADDPQDIRTMGGLWSKTPVTAVTFLVATLAIAGVPGLSGFFSKDEILWKALSSPYGSTFLWAVGSLTAVLTAFYMFRLFFLTFTGSFRGDAAHAAHVHDGGWPVKGVLIALAVPSALAGYIGLPHVFHVPNLFATWLQPVFGYAQVKGSNYAMVAGMRTGELGAMVISIVLAGLGIAAAYVLYVRAPTLPARLAGWMQWPYTVLVRKYYVDELYDWLIVKPLRTFSDLVLFRLIDRRLIDFAVEGSGRLVRGGGALLRLAQSGNIATYLLYMAAGALVVIVALTGGAA